MEKKSGPSIRHAGKSHITAVARRDVDKARAFAEQYDVELCTSDPAEVITHADVDIVYVATPPAAHRHPLVLIASPVADLNCKMRYILRAFRR